MLLERKHWKPFPLALKTRSKITMLSGFKQLLALPVGFYSNRQEIDNPVLQVHEELQDEVLKEAVFKNSPTLQTQSQTQVHKMAALPKYESANTPVIYEPELAPALSGHSTPQALRKMEALPKYESANTPVIYDHDSHRDLAILPARSSLESGVQHSEDINGAAMIESRDQAPMVSHNIILLICTFLSALVCFAIYKHVSQAKHGIRIYDRRTVQILVGLLILINSHFCYVNPETWLDNLMIFVTIVKLAVTYVGVRIVSAINKL